MDPYVAALIVGIVASPIEAALWRIPYGMLSMARLLRTTIGGAFAALVLALAAELGLRLGGMPHDRSVRIAAGAGLVLGLAFRVALSARDRRVRGALLLARRLLEPEARAEAEAALGKALDEAERAMPIAGYARLLLVIVGSMITAGKVDDAERRLAALLGRIRDAPDANAPTPETRTRLAQASLTCALRLGKLEAARRALEVAVRPAGDPRIEAWLVVEEALLDAVEGGTERALEHVARLGETTDPSIAAARRVVTAHVLACRGDDEGAREELRSLTREAGERALEQAVRPVGPATDLARAMIGAEK